MSPTNDESELSAELAELKRKSAELMSQASELTRKLAQLEAAQERNDDGDSAEDCDGGSVAS